ncbi:non-hydrolyzing UDP-N-acetylglucosamine 2-epimerase [Prochlorococcus marinus]|uniref:non-hydrolyzing UDP-N-acetylglucosamine 2-epimerase n=1 Tax=Prochlorococcus marinus TaxID=1219 RepID=UPI001ADC26AE|nr:UDP-N-acetylglucosamine 2-epimerase (non-hydrolyzing) [Prochlorococcus marinus]MBO8221441.1 UDP-N-acetylglucosamine 2-epimerase (non-hydrolyzing) [Prochlorococcus marinus CUG1417]MBW3074251.1 UDP-N-acetylglucosamine 2-epimerase (non-hydrolyzing) [Prochlorococcus marinus str. MU1417]
MLKNKNSVKKITFIIGTRPEAIKLAPVIEKFIDCKYFYTRVILTGQHIDLVKDVLNLFSIKYDKNLKVMNKGNSLSEITSLIINSLSKEFDNFRPNLVIVQGDTNSAFSAALSAFYKKIKIGHIEAGLRTNDIYNPFPEEVNRRLISQISNLHFAPTKISKDNLIKENVDGNIFVTGNTVIDSLLKFSKGLQSEVLEKIDFNNKKVVLSTIHRRENWGINLNNIIQGFEEILEKNPSCFFIIIMHPNKKVSDPIIKKFSNNKKVLLLNPLKYTDLIHIMKNCYFIMSDSGGIQEEAPTFGKPVLILRDTTERLEAINAGVAKLIGTNKSSIVEEADQLLNNKEKYQSISNRINPFGDGKASQRIFEHIKKYFFS